MIHNSKMVDPTTFTASCSLELVSGHLTADSHVHKILNLKTTGDTEETTEDLQLFF